MRGIVFGFLSILALPTFALGYVLHVGDRTFTLSQTKYTTPSLAFGVPNDGVWYAPLTRQEIPNTLHIKTAHDEYMVDAPDAYAAHIAEKCPEIFVDTENYTYDANGRLIGADERLWLKNNSTETGGYIDTNFIANNNTRIKTKIYQSAKGWFFCARQKVNMSAFCFLWTSDDKIRTDYGTSQASSVTATSGIYIIDKNKNVTTYSHPNGQTYTLTQSTQNFTTPMSMPILAGYNDPNTLKVSTYRYYYFKIWDNDVLVRDMVPVPACMRIGDFVVPENGMWDIVNQQFYGNSGTGEFIYGKD